MNRYFRTGVILTLSFLMMLTQVAAASEADWQLIWQESGTLQEEVKVTGRDIVPLDPDWQIRQDGDQYILSREVANWTIYQNSQDRLPLQMTESNYLLLKQTKIDIGTSGTGLFSQLNDLNGFQLTMVVPGFIMGKDGERLNASSATWLFSNSLAMLNENRMLKFITIDGLLSGIAVFSLGLLVIVIKFRKHLKNAERIIEEEYSAKKSADDGDIPPE